MRSLSIRPPRLALPLLLSAVLSTATLALHLISEPNSFPPPILPAFFATYSVYYLIRYLQRCVVIKHESLAGGDAWPVTQLFPGKHEHVAHPLVALLAIVEPLAFAQDLLPQKSVAEMRWSADGPAMALMVVYVLGLVANGVVLLQACRVILLEDNVRCAEAHDNYCTKCQVKERELATQATLPTHPAVHPNYILGPIVILTNTLLHAMQINLKSYDPRIRAVLSVLPALALLHSSYFFLRIRRAAREKAVAWPSTPIVPGRRWQRVLYLIGHNIFLGVYATGIGFALANEDARRALALMACLVGLAGLHFVAFITGVNMDRTETRARCAHEGHAWKCMRWCSLQQDQEAGTPARPANDDAASVQASLDAFSKAMAPELRLLLGEVGRLREEKRVLQEEINYLHGKRESGGELNSEMGLEHVATLVPIPATRTWRSVPLCPSRRSRCRESAPDGAQSSPPLPRGLSPAVSWATWQPHPEFMPTPTEVSPLLDPSMPGLFGPRSPPADRE